MIKNQLTQLSFLASCLHAGTHGLACRVELRPKDSGQWPARASEKEERVADVANLVEPDRLCLSSLVSLSTSVFSVSALHFSLQITVEVGTTATTAITTLTVRAKLPSAYPEDKRTK